MRAYFIVALSVTLVSHVLAQRPGGVDQRQQRSPADIRRRQSGGPAGPTLEPKASTGLIPLADMAADVYYLGEDGGLYGAGRNTPPEAHLKLAMSAAGQIRPLDAQGRPSPEGRIVMVSSGMSNTRMKFETFRSVAAHARNPALVLVNGAQGGRHASTWQSDMVWEAVDRQLAAAGVTPSQVQAMWMLHAIAGPSVHGEFPAHARKLKEFTAAAVRKAAARYPNLKLIYLSSRTYAGYATGGLNPEPYAYESAYAMRWLIQEQMAGRPELNADPSRGAVRIPVLLWGPYLWADGEKGRSIDPMAWLRQDYAGDGTHPSAVGCRKAAERMAAFFGSDPTSASWFSGAGPTE